MGLHGALSALLGGLINVVGGRGVRVGRDAQQEEHGGRSDARGRSGLKPSRLRSSWLSSGWCWRTTKQLVPAAFFGTFVLTVIFFSMAIFVRDR